MTQFSIQLNTDEVLKKITKPNTNLIDIRPVEAYNGWQLQNEIRGGHIKSAKSFPLKWTKYIDCPDIIHSKNIDIANDLIIYGYNKQDIELMADYFSRANYSNIYSYYSFVDEWSPNPNLPMSKLCRHKQLLSAQWLNTLIKTGSAPGFEKSDYVILHSYYRNKNDYDTGHIPGAIAFDTNSIESLPNWNLRTPRELNLAFQKAGISTTTTVILYGKFSNPDLDDPFPGSSAGHLAAMRCAFAMLYSGVEDIRLLNGGFQSWIDEGFEISQDNYAAKPVADFGATIPQHPELLINTEQAKQILNEKNENLVCVRSWREYIGETSGYNYIQKKGRIPGAVFAECGSDAYHMENYRNVDHTTREYHEIESLWAKVGITPQKHNSFYCGTGWRASEAFLNAWLMGWSDISIYDGGWFEWSMDDHNPYETGLPFNSSS